MADIVTTEQLQNASTDCETLETAVNGDNATDVTARLGQVFPSIAKAIYTIIQAGGFVPFDTTTNLTASVPTVAKQAALALDTGRVWYWNGSSWTDKGSMVTFAPIGSTVINTLTSKGFYYQSISANVTVANNYPSRAVGNAVLLFVVPFSTNTIMQVACGNGGIATRITFNTGSSWSAWNESLNAADYTALSGLVTTLENKATARLEWFVSGSNGQVSYDKSTKTLSWANPLIASYKNTTPKRISVAAGSFTFSGTGYEVLYLDTTTIPADGVITSALLTTCLKIGSYTDAAAQAFTDKVTQIPLVKLNPQGVITPCAGFVPIKADAVLKDTFTYNKVSDRISMYLPATNGNLVKYLIRHDVQAFDGTSSQSQLDIWRLERAIECTQALVEGQEIVTYGEWACAMRETVYPADHVGGVHGDELLTSAFFIVDGVYKDPLTWTGTGEAKEIQLMIKSVIYRLNTQTALANHYLHYRISKNSVKLHQELEILLNTNLDRLWLALLPTNRVAANSVQVSTRDIRKGVIRDVSASGFTQVYTPLDSSTVTNVSGDKYSTEVTVSSVSGALSTADVYVSNDPAYNKIYVSAIGGASSGTAINAGTKLSWDTEFKVNAT